MIHGEGTLKKRHKEQTYNDEIFHGKFYEGQKKSGTLTTALGVYEGEFKNGLMHSR